ncbi:MAG TPA: hypothetical protein VD814_08985 [Nocardioides sp.]|nr:hypothetical protein [Nocardioides sp.]
MSDSTRQPAEGPGGLLTPTSRAVAGLALAVAGLLGNNALTGSLQLLAQAGPEAGDPGVFGIVLGLSTAVPAGLALLVTWRAAQGTSTTWQAHVSRAAVVVALLVLVAAAVMVVGGLLRF